MELGRYGVWVPGHLIEDDGADAARQVEELGFGTFWLGASPRLASARSLLEATETLTIATGVVNAWDYEPVELANEYAELVGDFPDRVLVGIGIGHSEATREYARPLATMGAFLDGLDDAGAILPADRRCLAALGPNMLDLSGSRSRGSISYFVPVAHTDWARQRLGPGPMLAPVVAFSLNADPQVGRSESRAHAEYFLGLSNYRNSLLRSRFSEEDCTDGGSDRLIDAVVPHGEPERIAVTLRNHLEAGADHVALQPVGGSSLPRAGWAEMAEALSLTG